MSKNTLCVDCFKTLGIKSRLEIYNFLKKRGGSPVYRMVKLLKLTQPTVSYHLKEMRQSGLLDSEKVGKNVIYSINKLCPYFSQECILNNLNMPESVKNAKN